MIEASPLPIVEIDRDGLITVWNKAATHVFGWTFEEVRGKPLPFIPPEKQDEHRRMREQDLSGSGFVEREIRRVRKDGVPLDLLVNTNPIRDADGRVAGIVSIYQDVTAKRAQERMVRAQADVLANMAEGVSITTADGIITWTNPAEDAMFGYAEGELRGRHVTALNAYPPEENARIVAQVIEHLQAEGRWTGEWSNRKKDGTVFTTYSRISAIEIDGEKYWVCVQEDITEARRLLEMQRVVERQLTMLVEASGALLSASNPDVVVDTVLGLGQRFISADAYSVWRCDDTTGDWLLVGSVGLSPSYERAIRADAAKDPVLPNEPMVIEDVRNMDFLSRRSALYEAEGIRSMLMVPLRPHGNPSGTIVFYYRQPHRFTEPEKAVAKALGNLAASALVTAEMHARERMLRTQAEAAERRAAFLAEAGAVLSSSLDYETTLAGVARLVVPWFADWCGVDVISSSGELERLSVAHVDPAKVEFAYEFNRRFPPGDNDARHTVIRTGSVLVFEEITEEQIRERIQDPERLHAIRQLGLKSLMLVPLVARGRTLGVLTFATAESNRKYTPADVAFAEEIARRAAVAVDNARLHRETQEIADRLELAQHAAGIGTFDWDIPSGRTLWTDELRRLFGLDSGVLSGTIADWANRTHPGDVRALQQKLEECWKDRRPTLDFAFRFFLPSGELRHMEGSGRIFYDSAGRPLRMVGINIDVTNRKEAERFRSHLAAIVQFSQDAIFSEDLNGIVTTWNQGAERIFGYDAGEIVGRPSVMLAPHGRAAEAAEIQRRVRTGESVENYETKRRRRDGQDIDVSLTVSPLRDAGGAVTGISKVARNITDRKTTEQMLARKADELARSNADLEQFAYAAAHDLQEPLRNVCVYSQLIGSRYRGRLDSEADTFIQYVVNGAKRMQSLVDDLLAYTRAVDTSATVNRTADANAAFAKVLANLQTAIAEQNAVVTRADLPVLPVFEPHVVQLLQNLVGNALKYSSPARIPQVHVSATREGASWVFSVTDNGIGIKPEYQDRIFGVFKRLHGTEIPGTGIGLAICSRIVAHYGGRIWVESQFGRGSAFLFTLPAGPALVAG